MTILSVFMKKAFVSLFSSIFIVGVFFLSGASATTIVPGPGNGIDRQIFDALKTRYKDGLRLIESQKDGEEVFLQLLVTYENQNLPSVVLVLNTVDRSVDEEMGRPLSNVIQVQAYPQIASIPPEDRAFVLDAIQQWQYFRLVPQAVYLSPDQKVVYGWDIPVFEGNSMTIETIAQVIDDLALSWIELGTFLGEQTGIVKGVKNGKTPIYKPVATYYMLSAGRGMTPESEERFQEFLKHAQEQKDKHILVRGYVSSDMDSKENRVLSQKRAENVAEMILVARQGAGRVRAEGMGIQDPIESNDTKEGRNKNRRVEILMEE